MEFHEMMKRIGQHASGDDENAANRQEPYLAPDIEAIRLQDALASFQKKHTFKVGQIVRQKPGVSCYRKHSHNNMSIVVEILDPPLMFESADVGAETPYWRQPLDMIAGHIDGDSFVTFHVDSRRFEPVPEEEIRLRVRNVSESPQ